MIKDLPEDAKHSAYDFVKYLSFSRDRLNWSELEDLDPDDIPLSKEERRQLKTNSAFVSWEDTCRELNIPADLDP
jgi:hypothetical protein